MRRFIVFLGILILSIFIGLRIADDPGLALFAYQKWTVEMPLWLAIVAELLLFYLVYVLTHFLASLGFSFYRFKNWLQWRREHKSYSKTLRGLLSLIEGEWAAAEISSLNGIGQSESPLINYLAAAKAAHEQKKYSLRDVYLQQAQDFAPQAEVAIGIVQAQFQLKQGLNDEALATLKRLRGIAPKHRYVLKQLERLYIHAGAWRELLKLLPSLRKAKLVEPEHSKYFETMIYREIFTSPLSQNDGYLGLQNTWDCIPSKLRLDPDLIAAYAKRLMQYPEAANELEALLNKTLKRNWNNTIALIYSTLPVQNPGSLFTHAEAWQKLYPNQPILLFILGRLAKRCKLWGKSRTYFESSLTLDPNPITYAEYADLLDSLGESDAAAKNYKKGLMLTCKID